MKATKFLIVAGFALNMVIWANPGGAALVTSLPGGTVIPMPYGVYFGPGPITFGPGITWSSTNATIGGIGGIGDGSVFGSTGIYGFGPNGSWDGFGPFAALNDSYMRSNVTDTMTFAFSRPVSAVGGFMNYAPDGNTPTIIAVYDASGTLIERAELTFLTGGGTNTGFFYAFQETSNTISYLRLTGNCIGITNLTTKVIPNAITPVMLLLLD
jgi:hypothetical protein